MLVLVADDEPAFLDLVTKTITERTDHALITAEDGGKALEGALSTPRPDVLILDWVMPKLTGTQVCRLVRGAGLHPQPYVLFVTARCRREELLECLASGADDLLTKPFAPDVLLSRLELAQRRLENTSTGVRIKRALREAQDEGDGELVVRSGKISARILFCQGQIAWVQMADSFGSLLNEIAPHTGLDAEAAQEIVAECRRTGKGLGETLKTWGLVEGEQLREITRTWLEKKLANLSALPNPECLFLPGRQRCSSELLFGLDELSVKDESAAESTPSPSEILQGSAPSLAQPSFIPSAGFASAFFSPAEEDPSIIALLERALRGDGVVGVAAIDRQTGSCVGRLGQEMDPDIVWAQLRMVNAISKKELLSEAHVGTKKHHHLIALIPQRPNVMVHAQVNADQASLASARLSLRSAVRGARLAED